MEHISYYYYIIISYLNMEPFENIQQPLFYERAELSRDALYE